jgi:hypothetical protein
MNTPYRIFLDDLRTIEMVYPNQLFPDFQKFMDISELTICRTMEEAVALIESKGYLPNFISFDNDLGEDSIGKPLKEGIDFAHWIVESVLDGKYVLEDDFEFFVHSANSIAGPEIRILLNNFINFQKRN